MTKSVAPKDINEFNQKLLEISEGLPKRLRQCADFVGRNTDIIAISTVADLSKGAGVQPSAFMRFCTLMGFSGYSEMQRLFRETHAQRWPDYSTRLENLRASDTESPFALLADFADAGRTSLENLTRTIDADVLERAVTELSKTSMIHIVGLSRAFPVATYLAYALEKMDVPAILHGGFGNLQQHHAILPDDVLIVVTFSPYSQESLELATYAHSKQNKIVAITDTINSQLHALDAMILSVSEEDVGAFRALAAPLSLAITLAVAVGTRRKNSANGK